MCAREHPPCRGKQGDAVLERRLLRNAAVVFGILFGTACGSTSPPVGPTFTTRVLTIEGPPTVDPGQTVTFKAILRNVPDSTGTARDVSAETRWSTNNPAVLSIDGGLATGHRDGIAVLEATLTEGMQAVRPVTVGNPAVPPPPAIAVGQTVSGTVGAFVPQVFRLPATSTGTLVARLAWTDPFNDSALSLKVDAAEFGRPGGPPPVTARVAVQAGVEYTLVVTMLFAESQVNVNYTLTTAIE
jgi:hypothetical protein